MRAVRVIPCLDVEGGRVVKGIEFKGLRDAGDPVELATRYDAEGADELVLLDITASSELRSTMLHVVEHAAEEVFIPLTVGGGVRSVADARALLRAGADKVGVNSAAVSAPELIEQLAGEFGAQCVVVAIDARRVTTGPTGRSSPTVGAMAPASTPSPGPRAPPSSAQVRSCSPRWTVTAPRPAMTSS